MGGAPLILALTMVAVDPGWEPTRDGGYRFILQVPPAQLAELQQTGSITSRIPDELVGRITEVEIRVGQGSVPRPALTDVSLRETTSYPPPPDSVDTVRAQDTGFSAPPPLGSSLDQVGAAAADAARNAGERTIDNMADEAKRLFNQIPTFENGPDTANGGPVGARAGGPATTAPGATANGNQTNPARPATSSDTNRGFAMEQNPGWSSTSPSTTRNPGSAPVTTPGVGNPAGTGGYPPTTINQGNGQIPAVGGATQPTIPPTGPGTSNSGNFAGNNASFNSINPATGNRNSNPAATNGALNRSGLSANGTAGGITIGDIELSPAQYADLTPEDIRLLQDVRRAPRINPNTGLEEIQLIDAVTFKPLAYDDPRYLDMLDLLVHLDQLSRVDSRALKKQVQDRLADEEQWRLMRQTNRELAQRQQDMRVASTDPQSLSGTNLGAPVQGGSSGAPPTAYDPRGSRADYLANRSGANGTVADPSNTDNSRLVGNPAGQGRESLSPSDITPSENKSTVQTMPLVILILIISILVNCYMAYCISRVLQRYRNLVASTRVSPLSA